MANSTTHNGRGQITRLGQVVMRLCALLCLVTTLSDATNRQAGSASQTTNRIRFRITDSENGRALTHVCIRVVYHEDKIAGTARKELEVKTNEDGIAEIPKPKVERLAVEVEANGYQRHWLWVRSDRFEEVIHIRLEKWTRSAKQ
jgi:hypothetical protein